jgi:PEGA domain
MYRVIAIVVAGLALAACSSNSQWLDALKPGPTVETVRFESEPPGAEVKLSNGQTCRTPCALAIPHPESGGYALTFTLNGYLPDTEQVQLTSMGDNSQQLRPNPVVVQLTPAPPPPKAKKKIVRKKPAAKPASKPAAKKPKAKPAPRAKPAAAAPAPQPAQPQSQQAPSPWPPVQPQPAR